MSIRSLISKIQRVTFHKLVIRIYSKVRIIKYKLLSDCKQVSGKPNLNSAVLVSGAGHVRFGKNVYLGVQRSPYFFSTYIYLEVRQPGSVISIEDGVWINNNANMISDGPGITICKDTLIGPNFSVFDSDFHELHPAKRLNGIPLTGRVLIRENVFIGANVTILKGVEIGANSVIANGSVVTKSIPSNVIAGGNPCKVIKELNIN